MKLYKEEHINEAGNQVDHIWFATNRKELELLSGILEKAYSNFPRCISTTVECDRLRNMKNTILKYLRGKNNEA